MIGGVLTGALVLVFAAALVAWPRTGVVEVHTQPSTVVYAEDTATHVAVLVRTHAPVGVDRHAVVLGKDPSGRYGHHVRLEATDVDPTDLSVEWVADGAWLVYGSGHRVFVPATFFLGGR